MSGGDGASADVVWDAADLACGPLLLKLRGRMESLRAGQILRLIAQDSSAAEDLPAWCRLTGHTLVAADHPVYLIRRKEG